MQRSGDVAFPGPGSVGAGEGRSVGGAPSWPVGAVWGDEVGALGVFVVGEAGDVEELPVERSAGQLDVFVAGQGGVEVGAVVVGLVDPGPGVLGDVLRLSAGPGRHAGFRKAASPARGGSAGPARSVRRPGHRIFSSAVLARCGSGLRWGCGPLARRPQRAAAPFPCGHHHGSGRVGTAASGSGWGAPGGRSGRRSSPCRFSRARPAVTLVSSGWLLCGDTRFMGHWARARPCLVSVERGTLFTWPG